MLLTPCRAAVLACASNDTVRWGAIVEIFLLGPVQAKAGGQPVDLGVRKQRLLLAVLAMEVNRPVAMHRLIDLIWPEDPPATARGMLYTYVSRLRSVLACDTGVVLSRQDSSYLLACEPRCVDVHRFTALVSAARRATDDERAVAALDNALALWRGPVLAGIATDEVRDRLCGGVLEARLTALEDRADALVRLGRHDPLIGDLRSLTREHPDRPRLVGALMLALHRSGRTASSLEIYTRVRRELADAQGLNPAPDLQRLHQAILRDEVAVPSTTWRRRPAQALMHGTFL